MKFERDISTWSSNLDWDAQSFFGSADNETKHEPAKFRIHEIGPLLYAMDILAEIYGPDVKVVVHKSDGEKHVWRSTGGRFVDWIKGGSSAKTFKEVFEGMDGFKG